MEELSIVFDEFRDHIGDECARGANAQLTTEDYGSAAERYTGGKYIQIRLQNVQDGDRALYESVERFREGTKLKTIPHPETGMLIYTVFVPLARPFVPHKSAKRHKRAHALDAPRPEELYKWLVALFALVAAAATTTRWDQWAFIHKHFW